MNATYIPSLVVLSIAIAILASYTALHIARNIERVEGVARMGWLLGGSLAMGTGIWSMHFIGMLAYRIPGHVIAYDVWITGVSFLVAVASSAIAFWTICRRQLTRTRLAAASVAMGAGIAGMHYLGMAAMHTSATIDWSIPLIAVSVVAAVLASGVAIRFAFSSRHDDAHQTRTYLWGGGAILGCAIAGLHYIGMAAARFTTHRAHAEIHSDTLIATPGLAVAIVGATALILCLSFAGTLVARELARAHALANENQQLYLEAQHLALRLEDTVASLRARSVEAESANRAKNDFLAVMSHELRTPLNAIIGFTDLLEIGIPAPVPDPAQPYLSRISFSAKHLLELIDDVLTFTRAEAGQEVLHTEITDIGEVVRAVIPEIEARAAYQGLSFHLDLAPGSIPAMSDPRRVRQILINLLGNALKFTDAGAIALIVETHGDTLTFSVRDTGIGMSPEQVERACDAFWQADSSRSRRSEGAGLGLAVTRKLVLLLGGSFHIESEEGKGSNFTVRLPLGMTDPAQSAA